MNIITQTPGENAPAQINTPPMAPTGSRVKRHVQPLLPLWRITGTLTVKTPLALGTGEDEPIASHLGNTPNDQPSDRVDSFIPAVARDYAGHPYIPGSSLKGALRALAGRVNLPMESWQRWLGSDKAGGDIATTTPGVLEVRNAYVQTTTLPAASGLPDFVVEHNGQARHTALIPHVVINRHTGTAEEGLLFQEQVVPPDVAFAVELMVRGEDVASVRQLLGLLEAINPADNAFALGKNTVKSNGSMRWQLSEVKHLDSFAAMLNGGDVNLWASAEPLDRPEAMEPALITAALNLPVALKFHTPFLVYQDDMQRPGRQQGDPNGIPRRNHQRRGVLPASSLLGALRSQAERILRTLGAQVERPHGVNPVDGLRDAANRLDEVGLLFGATGWKGLLQCSDFLAPVEAATLNHEMLAIDRITGGGKDGAKFCILALDCPTLSGHLRLDLPRWRKLAGHDDSAKAKAHRVLSLLLHTLRDLDEGDIALGYGASKGYGISSSQTAVKLHQKLTLAAVADQALPTLTQIDQAWAAKFGSDQAHHPANLIATQTTQSPAPVVPATPTGAFHNPFAFLPWPELAPNDPSLPWAGYLATKRGDNHHSHAQFAATALSGRILCKLTTKTPIFIGAGDAPARPQLQGKPALKANFKLNQQIALPATSLRGVISSLHESITASAMRVMENRTYSVRQDTGQEGINAYNSSAIGRVHIGDDDSVSIEPLTLPILVANHGYQLPESFRSCYPTDDAGHAWVFGKVLLEPQKMRPPLGCDYDTCSRSGFSIASAKAYWYLPLAPLLLSNLAACGQYFRDKRGFAIGQKTPDEANYPLSQAEFNQLEITTPHLAKDFVRGFLRAMHHPHRQMPPRSVRKYELFVPYPVELDDFEPYTLRCTPACLERFNQLSTERFDSQANKRPTQEHLQLPYSPINSDRTANVPLSLKQGDLVFFKPTTDGNAIAEVSYSSIWRARLETDSATLAKAYRTIDGLPRAEHAPLQPDDRRTLMSPSEMLFGFVQDQGQTKKAATLQQRQSNPAKAFKGKLRIGYGLSLEPPRLLDSVSLKILSSPKPPSASLYFRPRNVTESSRFIPKGQLTGHAEQYVFQGRKAYLHPLRAADASVARLNRDGTVAEANAGTEPWRTNSLTENHDQKAIITPIEAGQDFYFEIDFNNLSRAELEALCATLTPTSDFEHKIGMGKPIGLGSVRVTPVGLYLIDRAQRYRTGASTNSPRYQAWRQATDLQAAHLPKHLQCTVQTGPDTSDTLPTPTDLANVHMARLSQNNPALYRALALLGNPNAVLKPVHYPQVAGASIEGESFKWFVANNKTGENAPAQRQHLKAFTDQSNSLPAMDRLRE